MPNLTRTPLILKLIALVFAGSLASGAKASPSAEAIEELQKYLAGGGTVAGAAEESFATVPLSKEQADQAAEMLWRRHAAMIRQERSAEMKAKRVKFKKTAMKFEYRVFGEAPEGGRSLYISMHGGGGAPTRVNDQQWQNQIRLYEPEEGIYVAPRAPSDEWNLWHRRPVGKLFDRLIENLIVLSDVNPNKVYVMGYSAGGDGVYQLAPRMADRWAAAAMMAGHPNDASPLGLRNIGFILQVGGQDSPYKRNTIAAQWGGRLKKLKNSDPQGYEHLVKIYPNKGHWMDREDAMALPWMAKFTRNPYPDRVVWRQDDVTRDAFYWLAVEGDQKKRGTTVRATRSGPRFDLRLEKLKEVTVLLNDKMTPLNEEVTISVNNKEVYSGTPERKIETLAKSLAMRGDPDLMFSAEVTCGVEK